MFLRLQRSRELFIALWFVVATAQAEFSDIYVFGDSLSDSGNLAALPQFSFLTEYPYDDGFSNGPRAVQLLAAELGLNADPSLHLIGQFVGSNFAVSGARARAIPEALPGDLADQLDAFFLSTSGVASAEALYVVFIGSNDVRDARDEPNNLLAHRILGDALQGIIAGTRALVRAGAQSVMVVNVADIGSLPETQILAEQKRSFSFVQRATRLTKIFNGLLLRRIEVLEEELGVDVVVFDLFRMTEFVRNDGPALGLINVTDACFSSLTFTFFAVCEEGAKLDQFLFFDEMHPTAVAHDRLARGLFALVPAPFENVP